MKIQIPEKVEYIINKLIENGFEAYAVGGCVRDTILGRIPEDWDITTSASPQDVKKLFKRTIDTGIAHGTVTVMLDKDGYEVTTYRIDGEYEDNRHPKQVEFTKNLTEDLRRRDFTINAMAYNHQDGLIDEFGGLEDIQAKIIRCVGSAEERFDEDGLRILRAIRFLAQLGFEIEQNTKLAIRMKAENLKNISQERIRVEIDKLLISTNPRKLLIAYETGITKIVLPEFDLMMETMQNNPHHVYNVGEHTIKAVEASSNDPIIRWTMLLHDVAKPMTKTTKDGIDHFSGHQEKGAQLAKVILKRLKFDNSTIDTVARLVKWHDHNMVASRIAMRKTINIVGEDLMQQLFKVKRADILAQNPISQSKKLHKLEEAIDVYEQIIIAKECVSLKGLAVSGKDLIEIGYKPGIQIGVILTNLLSLVLEDPIQNKRETLLEVAKKLI